MHAGRVSEFDMTTGLNGGTAFDHPIPPGIPRTQASLRLVLDDMDLLQNQRFNSPSSYFQLALHFTVAVLQGRSISCDPLDILMAFLPLAAKSSLMKNFPGKIYSIVWSRPDSIMSYAVIFFTNEGYLSYGPQYIQEGDVVCILNGNRVPVLLRKVEDYYHFVSICFVLGLMDGEAAQRVERGESVIQRFDIYWAKRVSFFLVLRFWIWMSLQTDNSGIAYW